MANQFHEETLARLGQQFELAPDAVGMLDQRATELGIHLPASFREWFGMQHGVELLRRYSNSDKPIAIGALGQPVIWTSHLKLDLVPQRMVAFMIENQGVCVWAIRLGEGEDPPVIVAVGEPTWRVCSEKFSIFIACQVWDHCEVWGRTPLMQAQAAPLAQRDLEFLREHFDEGPVTHGWPGRNQLRFHRGAQRVLIYDGEGQADWALSARDNEDASALAGTVWHCSDLRTSLWSNDGEGEKILERLREDAS